MISSGNGLCSDRKRVFFRALKRAFCVLIVCSVVSSSLGCGIINVGKWQGIVRTDPDEAYYLVKSAILTAGSAAHPRKHFDHYLQDSVHLIFTPARERRHYISKTIWYDPSGEEYKTMRQTHDRKKEEDQGIDRKPGAVAREYSMSLHELWKHKPGLWKVELYLDNELARRLAFSVR